MDKFRESGLSSEDSSIDEKLLKLLQSMEEGLEIHPSNPATAAKNTSQANTGMRQPAASRSGQEEAFSARRATASASEQDVLSKARAGHPNMGSGHPNVGAGHPNVGSGHPNVGGRAAMSPRQTSMDSRQAGAYADQLKVQAANEANGGRYADNRSIPAGQRSFSAPTGQPMGVPRKNVTTPYKIPAISREAEQIRRQQMSEAIQRQANADTTRKVMSSGLGQQAEAKKNPENALSDKRARPAFTAIEELTKTTQTERQAQLVKRVRELEQVDNIRHDNMQATGKARDEFADVLTAFPAAQHNVEYARHDMRPQFASNADPRLSQQQTGHMASARDPRLSQQQTGHMASARDPRLSQQQTGHMASARDPRLSQQQAKSNEQDGSKSVTPELLDSYFDKLLDEMDSKVNQIQTMASGLQFSSSNGPDLNRAGASDVVSANNKLNLEELRKELKNQEPPIVDTKPVILQKIKKTDVIEVANEVEEYRQAILEGMHNDYRLDPAVTSEFEPVNGNGVSDPLQPPLYAVDNSDNSEVSKLPELSDISSASTAPVLPDMADMPEAKYVDADYRSEMEVSARNPAEEKTLHLWESVPKRYDNINDFLQNKQKIKKPNGSYKYKLILLAGVIGVAGVWFYMSQRKSIDIDPVYITSNLEAAKVVVAKDKDKPSIPNAGAAVYDRFSGSKNHDTIKQEKLIDSSESDKRSVEQALSEAQSSTPSVQSIMPEDSGQEISFNDDPLSTVIKGQLEDSNQAINFKPSQQVNLDNLNVDLHKDDKQPINIGFSAPVTTNIVPTLLSNVAAGNKSINNAVKASGDNSTSKSNSNATSSVKRSVGSTIQTNVDPGKYFVQFASLPSALEAENTKDYLVKRFYQMLNNQPMYIKTVVLPDRGNYYRLRMGFNDKRQAENFCKDYMKLGGVCFVGDVRP